MNLADREWMNNTKAGALSSYFSQEFYADDEKSKNVVKLIN